MPNQKTAKKKKGLCIFPSRLGDTIIALSAFRDILQKYPEYDFTIVCSPITRPIFLNIPECSEIIPFIKQSYDRHWFSLWRKLVKQSFNIIVDMRGSALSRILRSPLKLYGGKKEKDTLRRLSLLKSFGLDEDTLPSIPLAEVDIKWATEKMGGGRWIGVCPTAGWKTKCWSQNNFIRFTHWATSLGYKVAVFYGEGAKEKELVEDLLLACPDTLDLGGGEKITHIAACLKKCKLFLGNDSGLSHLAAACAVKTLVLFGPTNALEYAPSGLDVHILKSIGRDGEGHMDQISFEMVVDKAAALLEG